MTRYIDADKLKEKAIEHLELATQRVADTPTNSPCYQRYISQVSERTHFIGLICDAPTEDVVIHCKDCKHQKKYWHEDRRMKDKGYWIYGCDLIDDPFIGVPVYGVPDQFCSSAEPKEAKDDT